MQVLLVGPTLKIEDFNHPAFDRCAAFLTRFKGHTVLNPAARDRTGGFDPAALTGFEDLAELGFDTARAAAANAAWLTESGEAVALMPGWEKSPAARADLALAAELGLRAGTMNDFGLDTVRTAAIMLADLHAADAATAKVAADAAREAAEGLPAAPTPGRPRAAAVRPVPVSAGRVADAFAPFVASTLAELDDPSWVPAEPFEAFQAAIEQVITQATATSGEVRVTSSTGAQKGTKIARYDLVPAGPLWRLATLYGQGATKYADRNWEKGYDLSLSFAALNRHLWAWWNGEDIDPEMGTSHLTNVAWHAFTLLQLLETHPEFDNRPSSITLPTPAPSIAPTTTTAVPAPVADVAPLGVAA